MSLEERIDVHAHFIPPFYREACIKSGHQNPDGMPAIPQWSEEAHLDLMKKVSISKSILSISSPGVHLVPGDDKSGCQLARECNEFAADISRRNPDKFGFWASLPLPDVSGSLEEIAYSLDELHAVGVTMKSNHHGTYLGDPKFDKIFEELNRRKARVFIHPTSPCVQHNNEHVSVALIPQYPNPMFEFMFDTARMVINLFLSGTISRCPNITFVIPHAGGSLPPIIQRFCSFATDILASEVDLSLKAVKETFQKQFYFDLAGFPFPDQIWGILRIVNPEKLLYGSDFPFTPLPGVVKLAEGMRVGLEEVVKDESTRKLIYLKNAVSLLE